eukprot:9073813-Alexandrium_andersonii.AAC.1
MRDLCGHSVKRVAVASEGRPWAQNETAKWGRRARSHMCDAHGVARSEANQMTFPRGQVGIAVAGRLARKQSVAAAHARWSMRRTNLARNAWPGVRDLEEQPQ